MSELIEQLEAGGLIAVNAAVPADRPTDVVDARSYQHPAMPGRTIVRLVPTALTDGADTELGLLGFVCSGVVEGVAQSRRRTLGFPAWALVYDPDHARHALDVLAEMKVYAKKIASKPGAAREGYEAIASRLQRQVPHFLPTFWEEVARSFVAAGNTAWGSQCFDKARTAEREFGLAIDEDLRSEAYLEFALLGALSVKSLQAYTKELAGRVGGAAAYERIYAIAVRRTLGGVPPWASLAKDLRSLARAANRDVGGEDERFLSDVLSSSALQRAPKGFWDDYLGPLERLAARDPAARRQLLDLFPTAGISDWGDNSGAFREAWMGVLARTHALSTLWTPDAPAEAIPAGGREAWLGRLVQWLPAGSGWALQIVHRAGDQLKAAPVPLSHGWRRPLDLDLVEAMLERGITPTFPDHAPVALATWATWRPAPARDGLPAVHRPSIPLLAVAHPSIAPSMVAAVDEAMGEPAFEQIAINNPAFSALREAWLAGHVEAIEQGIAAAHHGLARLADAGNPSMYDEYPAIGAHFRAATLAPALARTLRAGLFDELGWPAYDEALALLSGTAGPDEVPPAAMELTLRGQWPYLVLATRIKAVVLGPDGVHAALDLHLPGDLTPTSLAWVGGQLQVGWHGWARGSYESLAYWSRAPQDTFEAAHHWGAMSTVSPYDDGRSILIGTTRVTVGDRTTIPSAVKMAHDASRSWMVDDERTLVELDRATGRRGDKGAPAFLAEDEGRLADWTYDVVPSAWAAETPLGCVDGQYGCKRVLARAGDEDGPAEGSELRTITGEQTAVQLTHQGEQRAPVALVRWPGHTELRPVAVADHWGRFAGSDPHVVIGDPTTGEVTASMVEPRMGLGRLPPLEFWHAMRTRDAAGSAALRRVDEATAATLLAAAAQKEADVESAVAAAIPEVTSLRLRRAVAYIARLAAEAAVRLDALRRPPGAGPGSAVSRMMTDAEVAPSVNCLRSHYTWGDGSPDAVVQALGALLARGDVVSVQSSRIEPQAWLGNIRALAWCAARPAVDAEARGRLLTLLRCWVDAGLADDLELQVGEVRIERGQPWVKTTSDFEQVQPEEEFTAALGAERLWVTGCDGDDDPPWQAEVIACSSDGAWTPWPGLSWTTSRRISLRGDRAWLEAFLVEAAARGPRVVTPAQAAAFADAAGLTTAEAALALSTFELDKAEFKTHGVKSTDIKLAHRAMPDFEERLAILAAAAPDDPASLWSTDLADPQGPTARLAAAWVARCGKPVPVAADLLTAAAKELGYHGPQLLKNAANHARWQALHRDGAWEVDGDGDLVEVGESGLEAFTAETASEVFTIIAWLWPQLPVGDPLRGVIPHLYAYALARRSNANLWFEAGSWFPETPKATKATHAFFDAIGGELSEALDDDREVSVWIRRAGPMVATRTTYEAVSLYYRPAGLDPHTRAVLAAFAAASESDIGSLEAWERLAHPDTAALVARVTDTPLAAGTWEQDPRRSAPDTVAAAAAALGCSESAATLYLQILALIDPNRKAVLAWNGWTPKTYDAAAAELVAGGWLLEGKRARAGRDHFLPGGWHDVKGAAPHEEWKRPLYGWDPKAESFPLDHPLLLAPLHILYSRAWAQWQAGRPRFEEVRR